jgi:hypothetical protein
MTKHRFNIAWALAPGDYWLLKGGQGNGRIAPKNGGKRFSLLVRTDT